MRADEGTSLDLIAYELFTDPEQRCRLGRRATSILWGNVGDDVLITGGRTNER
jgi:hypothetical protein